jgi:dUTP pyrophosphatase
VTEVVPVPVRRLDPDLPMPAYAHPGDAGADLVAAEDVELSPGARCLVRTGVALALPDGFVGLVHPRSGLAARLGVTVLNAPGTVDAGYRGEILVNLVNHDPEATVKISRGDRIAQLLVQRVERVRFHAVDELPDTSRGAGGHGSTGGHRALPTQGSQHAPESGALPAQASAVGGQW